MTAPNPLIAPRQDSTQWDTGLGIIESVGDTVGGISSGSWIEAGLGVAGTSLGALGFVVDPVGTLVSWGVAWLMEHVKPLSDALDWLAGDPDTIASYAATWRNVGQAVGTARTDFDRAVSTQTAAWIGAAGDAYRGAAARQSESVGAAAIAAHGVGDVVEIVGMLVGFVRETVRDLVADCVATLIARLPQWLAEIAGTFGLATPHVVASAVSLISKWVARISEVITKLVRSVENLRPLLRRLEDIWAALRDGLRHISPTGGADVPTSPDFTPTARAVVPEHTADIPTVAGGTTAAPASAAGNPMVAPASAVPTVPDAGSTPTAPASPAGTTGTGTSADMPTPTSPQAGPQSGGVTSPTASPAPGPGPSTRYRDASGRTIPTSQLQHPDAHLLDGSLIDGAARNPNRGADAVRPGLDATHPSVSRIVTDDYRATGFDSNGRPLSQQEWNQRYWSSGTYDMRGNRDLDWPDPQRYPDGFAGPTDRRPTVLQPGEVIDRFGPGFGRYASPAGTPFPERGLPPDSLYDMRDPSSPGTTPGAPLPNYHQYRVVRPIPVWEGPIAPAMGQPGGGTQYLTPAAIVDLVNAGYLEEITP